MKYSETIVSKRLRKLRTSIFLIIILITWIGYTKLLYTSGFLLEKKNSAEVINTNGTGEIEKFLI